ncbi:LacI family DNA-binding transcriptional regulator [Bacillus sp. FJAT-49711]|uniref:LacI family DNA-binding transcriptional regulator n=1 Tax=Bacillus sp. FJAT-49711 TaxID=2833585 RepID=UPI001BC9F8C8|nr:LacI family DNA-binding transcriptional regulator [Bacillus sp. FJAT-49711]MBS4218633.1 LacI family DNA-binding transcriptional regulator [Bacillus sp. FJAT-49711]
MVTLKDVAKRAGVSVSTASYSINNSPLITNNTKEKVLHAAKEIGYRPNGLAKNLKEQKTNIIGLFLSGFTGPFFSDMVEGIQDVVMKKEYELVVCATVDTHRLLVERYVDGAIILNYHMEDELLESLANEKLPCVVLDRELKNPYIKNVLLPNEEGSAIAVQHLKEKGHKRIGFIAGSEASYDGETRLKGFKKEIVNQGLEFHENDLIRADFTEMSGYIEMKKYLMKSLGQYPSAVVCANDEMAIGAIKAIQESDIKVPEEISVVGFDDIYMSHFFTPSLSTIRVPRKKWGIAAANTLFKMLEQDFDFEPEPLTVELMSRHSG